MKTPKTSTPVTAPVDGADPVPADAGADPSATAKPAKRAAKAGGAAPVAPAAPERIAKAMARAGLCSRRDAEAWIADGRVSVNGAVLTTPAVTVGPDDVVLVDGQPLPTKERTRLFLFHKPRGCVTTTRDPEGRPTVFDLLPPDMPRVVTVGRLDINTEGLLILTNDGGLARVLELPSTGWLRRYRVRVHGAVEQKDLDALRDGVAIDGILYGAVEATLDRRQGDNAWLSVGLREGKNREVKNILGHLGLDVTRLIRVAFGPFELGDMADGAVEEVPRHVLVERLGADVVTRSGGDFASRPEDRLPQMPMRTPRPAAARATAARPARVRTDRAADEAPARGGFEREGRDAAGWNPFEEARLEREETERGGPRRGGTGRGGAERGSGSRGGAERGSAPRGAGARADGRSERRGDAAPARGERQPDARQARRRHEADIDHAKEAAPQRRAGRSRLSLSAKADAERRERTVGAETTPARQATRAELKGRGDAKGRVRAFEAEVRPRRAPDDEAAPARGERPVRGRREDRGADRGADRNGPAEREARRERPARGVKPERSGSFDRPAGIAEQPARGRAAAGESKAGPVKGPRWRQQAPQRAADEPESKRAMKIRLAREKRAGSPQPGADRAARSERPERAAPRGERAERAERGAKPERAERAAPRGDRPERGAKPERTGARGDRPERGERMERAPRGAGSSGPRTGGAGPKGSGPKGAGPRGSGPKGSGPAGGGLKPGGRDADRRR